MSRVRAHDTSAELRVRRAVHGMGFRFRLHRRDLPGTPDLVFPRYGVVVLVHGCFWHRHAGCKNASLPKSRTAFWENKFQNNVIRDRRVREELEALGWTVEIVWECETKNPDFLTARLVEIFDVV